MCIHLWRVWSFLQFPWQPNNIYTTTIFLCNKHLLFSWLGHPCSFLPSGCVTGLSQIAFLNCHLLGICMGKGPVWSLYIFIVCFMEMQARIFCGPIKILSGVLIGNREDFPGKIRILWLFLLLSHISYKKSSRVLWSLFPRLLRAASVPCSHSFSAFQSELSKSRRCCRHLYLST